MKRQKSHGFHEVDLLAADLVLGMLNSRDFEIAQSRTRLFAAWRDHDDFVQEREAAWFGLATAGARAELQTVSYAGFDLWGRLTGASNDLEGFDAFASQWRLRCRQPNSLVKGAFYAAPKEQTPENSGLDFTVRVLRDRFNEWRKGFARLSAITGALPTIDDYAALVVEYCIDGPRAQADR